jgi:hypothetical protein
MHQIRVSFQVFAQKGFIGTWIFWLKCISEMFTVSNSVFWLTSSPFCQHPPILASQEHLALRGLIIAKLATIMIIIYNDPNLTFIPYTLSAMSAFKTFIKPVNIMSFVCYHILFSSSKHVFVSESLHKFMWVHQKMNSYEYVHRVWNTWCFVLVRRTSSHSKFNSCPSPNLLVLKH